jgi:precorrin-2 C20-methyltransferase / precorrin-3B C17-methyltransferase
MSATATAGKLIGVGVGPGDPELMTVKAARALCRAGYHDGREDDPACRQTR